MVHLFFIPSPTFFSWPVFLLEGRNECILEGWTVSLSPPIKKLAGGWFTAATAQAGPGLARGAFVFFLGEGMNGCQGGPIVFSSFPDLFSWPVFFLGGRNE